LSKLAKWLGWTVVGVLLLILSFILAAAHYGWEFNVVLSGSMQPALKVGGLVVIKPAEAQGIKIGDIISFKLPDIDTPICHRVVDIKEVDGQRFFQTKGDANEEPDLNLIPASNVTGEEVFFVPHVGRLADLKHWGNTRVDLMGKRVPRAALVILGMGLAFIGLTLKEALEDIFRPSKRWKREMLKKRKERLMKRRKIFAG